MYYTPTFIDQLDEDYISHHGIKGMKWGVRRYQNYDGTRTSKGLARDRANSKKRRGLSNRTKQNLKTAAKIAGATAIGAASLYAISKMGSPKYNADDFAKYGEQAKSARDQMGDRARRATYAANAAQSARTGSSHSNAANASQRARTDSAYANAARTQENFDARSRKRRQEYENSTKVSREDAEQRRKKSDEEYARWKEQQAKKRSEAAQQERQRQEEDRRKRREYYKQNEERSNAEKREKQERKRQYEEEWDKQQEQRRKQREEERRRRGNSSDENVDRQHAPENIYAARERARRQAAEAEKQRQREAQKAQSVQQGKSTYDDLIRKHGETKAREVAKQNLDDAKRRVAEVQKRIAEAEKTGSRNAALNEEFQRAREARRVASDVYNKFGSDQ